MLPDVDPRLMPVEVPNPSHRHGAPSGKFALFSTDGDSDANIEQDLGLSWICTYRCVPDQRRTLIYLSHIFID